MPSTTHEALIELSRNRPALAAELLAAREIDVPEDAKARITGCTDLDQLNAWIRRAATTATTIEDVLD